MLDTFENCTNRKKISSQSFSLSSQIPSPCLLFRYCLGDIIEEDTWKMDDCLAISSFICWLFLFFLFLCSLIFVMKNCSCHIGTPVRAKKTKLFTSCNCGLQFTTGKNELEIVWEETRLFFSVGWELVVRIFRPSSRLLRPNPSSISTNFQGTIFKIVLAKFILDLVIVKFFHAYYLFTRIFEKS